MEKDAILRWARKYDTEYTWCSQKERQIGDRLRASKLLTKADLIEVVEWKFKDSEARTKRILEYIEKNEDAWVRQISSQIFSHGSGDDSYKIDSLCILSGVGPAVASTILTFHNLKHYVVFRHTYMERVVRQAVRQSVHHGRLYSIAVHIEGNCQ